MTLHSNPPIVAFTRYLRSPRCPRCSDTLFAAKATAFAGNGVIWHTWCCDSCHHEFRTTIAIPGHAA